MAWNLLFSSDIGLMSLAVIIGVIIIAFGLTKIFRQKIAEDAAKNQTK